MKVLERHEVEQVAGGANLGQDIALVVLASHIAPQIVKFPRPHTRPVQPPMPL